MPLNWDISKVKDWKQVTTETESPVTDAILMLTMTVGINHIKDETVARTFFQRVCVREKLLGVMMHEFCKQKGPGPEAIIDRPITLKDIKRRIGLYTNASPFTESKFWKEIVPKWAKEYASFKIAQVTS